VGCGSSGGGGAAPLAFVGEPSLQLPTMPSGYATHWRFSPSALARGSNAAEIQVMGLDGAPLSGWQVSLVPWMPAHGHGTSVAAHVHEVSPGVYVAQPLYLYMGGRWELRTTLAPPLATTEASATTETVVPSFDIR